jgi:hypothetical protein
MEDERIVGKNNVQLHKEVEILKPDHEIFLPGEVGAVLEWTVKRADGSIREQRTIKSKSFVKQFLDLWIVQSLNAPDVNSMRIRDTGNTLREICFSHLTFAANALTGDITFGIVVGTGNVAPAINDYALGIQIAHGTGAGQIQYGNVAFGLPAGDAASSHFTVTRDFANASGGDITVNEIGLYVKGQESNGISPWTWTVTTRYFMTIRDLIVGGISVPNGETLTINYRLLAQV